MSICVLPPADDDTVTEASDSDDGCTPRSPRRNASPSRFGKGNLKALCHDSRAAATAEATAALQSEPSQLSRIDRESLHTASSTASCSRDSTAVEQQQQGGAAEGGPGARDPSPHQVQSPFASPRNTGHDEVMEEVMASELLRVTQERDRLQGRVSLLETEVKNKDVMLHMLGG